uniref:FAD-binding FR-type domain-containing protein n=1 Tax=Kalanchoe fedtschenkoi TaxID=63787 RepID=A0A7N0VER0_KALFE
MARAIHLSVLKVLMVLICVTGIALWLVKPTKLWTRIWHGAEDRARTTVFRYYGLNFSAYTFPIIALAIIVYLYVDLQPKRLKIRQIRIANTAICSPLVISNTLGILSFLEILVGMSFIMFLTWTFYVRISNDFKKMTPAKTSQLIIWQFKYLKVATRLGSLAEVCLVLLLLPILRGMALFRFLGVQYEASIRYHIWLGTAMLFFATSHGLSTLFIWGIQHRLQTEVWKWQKAGRVYLAGEVALLAGLVIWITSLPAIRRNRFEVFYYTHHLYILFLIFFLFHVGDRHFYTVFGGIFLFGIDKLHRIVQSRPETCVHSACIFPCKAVQLTLPKDPRLNYLPTSVMFMKIPQLSRIECHPFSIISSSSAQEDTISILVKCEGHWSSSLYGLLQSTTDSVSCIPVAVEGPYGPSSLDFLRYDSLILIAGGVGIAPFLSIMQELASAHTDNRHRLPMRIKLIHVVKRSQDVCLLNFILPILKHQPEKTWDFRLKVFVTQEKHIAITLRDLLRDLASKVQTINFNTTCKHYAILGIESSSWMAAVALISTIMFLFLLTCFYHAFVPDLTKNSKQKSTSMIPDVVIICSFLLAIVSSCFLTIVLRWRKLRQQKSPVSHKQRKPVEPISLSSLDAHEIHFGARPDFTGN